MEHATLTRRRRGGQPGNRNRLVHGAYAGATNARRRKLRALVEDCREIAETVTGLHRRWEDWNRRKLSPQQIAAIDVQIALTLFHYLHKRLKTLPKQDSVPFEPSVMAGLPSGPLKVQIPASPLAGPVPGGEGL